MGLVALSILASSGGVAAQLPPQLAAPSVEALPPAVIEGLLDARPYAALEFSRAWLARVAHVRTRREQLAAEGKLVGATPVKLAESGAALTGLLRVPVLALRYADVPAPFPVERLERRLFGPNVGDTVSYTGYWDEVSDGLLRVEGTVTPWLELKHDADYYLAPEQYGWAQFGRIVELRREAIQDADRIVDFSRYDNDGADGIPDSGDDDGFADFVAFVYALRCPGDARAGAIWPHRAAMPPVETNDLGADGKPIRIADYVILPAVNSATCGPMYAGLLAHETGHALGLPDLYDYDGSSQGIGAWGLMGTGSHEELYSPAHLGAWEKEQLGWVRIERLNPDAHSLRLAPVELGHTVYRVDDPAGTGRYFLLENRQRKGSDSRLPGHGLLVWRIDPERAALGAWNTDERSTAVSLVEADGHADLAHGRRADAGDPYPGATSQLVFQPRSDRQLRLTDIEEHAGTITAAVHVDSAPPSLLPRTPVVRLTALAGGTAVTTIVPVERKPGATFGYTPVADSSWLTLDRTGDVIVIHVDPRALDPGAYEDTIRLLDGAGATAARILVSVYVATPGVSQIVATELPWSWGLAARGGHVLQASYGWDPLGLRPRPRVLQLLEGTSHPSTLARIPADALYAPVYDVRNGTGYVIARAAGANYLYQIPGAGRAELVVGPFGNEPAYGAASLPDGSVVVAQWSGELLRITPDGKVSLWDDLGVGVYQLAADSAGNVFAALYDGDVLRRSAAGERERFMTDFGAGRLVAVAATPGGDVFAAERGGQGRIVRFDSNGARTLVFHRPGAEFYGLAVDGMFLYALDLNRRELLRIPLARRPQPAVIAAIASALPHR